MDNTDAHLTLLTHFALVMGLVLLLPKLMERLRLPGVLGFILAGILLKPNLLGISPPSQAEPEGTTYISPLSYNP
ncbi:MAG: hypothetical protein ACKV19_21820 [Verrucomicrobiales bacterium]